MPHASLGRRAGLLLPLFSARSTRSWGIGDIADLARLGPWLRASGFRLLQVLPVNDMATGQTSPYSALSAMAIESLYIALDDVPDVQALGDAAFPPGVVTREPRWTRCPSCRTPTSWPSRTPRSLARSPIFSRRSGRGIRLGPGT